jgi:hypothetical protein
MSRSLSDYLLEHAGVDWPQVLSSWSWLLPPELTLWLVSRFADLFVVTPDGAVHMLDVTGGTFKKVAEDREAFRSLFDDNSEDWLMISRVDEFVNRGLTLKPGQCYGFKFPPVMGGEYSAENCVPISISDYLGACGSIHEQLKDIPDGTRVTLKPINVPKAR